MIKATELRIGNWVEILGQAACVSAIGALFVYLVDIGRHEVAHVDPIPLTPEILEKTGLPFIKVEKQRYYEFGPIQLLLQAGKLIPLYFGDSGPEIKHLHQLQNLYHALTGEEINIQL